MNIRVSPIAAGSLLVFGVGIQVLGFINNITYGNPLLSITAMFIGIICLFIAGYNSN